MRVGRPRCSSVSRPPTWDLLGICVLAPRHGLRVAVALVGLGLGAALGYINLVYVMLAMGR